MTSLTSPPSRDPPTHFCEPSESHQRSRRIPTNWAAGSHVWLGARRSCVLPHGRGGTVSFWTRLIHDSRNLCRRLKHLKHSAEPSQLRLYFYDLASFFGVSTKTGRHRIVSRSADDSNAFSDLKLFKILQVRFGSQSVAPFFPPHINRGVRNGFRNVLCTLIGPESELLSQFTLLFFQFFPFLRWISSYIIHVVEQ